MNIAAEDSRQNDNDRNNGKKKTQPEDARHKVMDARSEFDLPNFTPIYLNAASRTPIMKKTCEVGERAIARQMKTPWSIAEERDEIIVREAFASMINCKDSQQIAYTPSCSYAISLAAKNIYIEMVNKLKKTPPEVAIRRKILILEDQMSSNVYPWQNFCQQKEAPLLKFELRIVKEELGDCDKKTILSLTDNVLNILKNDDTISIVAIPNVHWCSGEIIDLIAVSEICQQQNIYLVIDGTQSLGCLPFDVETIKPDFLCASVHKHLFAPYGMCLLYVDKKWCDKKSCISLEYHEHKRMGASGNVCLPFRLCSRDDNNGDNNITMPYEEQYQSGAMRFCSGGRVNPIIIPMLAHSLNTIVYSWGVENISWLIKTFMTDKIKSECDKLGLYTVKNYNHILGVRQVGNPKFPEQISKWLKEKKNIIVSARFKYLRVAPHVYNTQRELHIFIHALREFMKLQLLSDEDGS